MWLRFENEWEWFPEANPFPMSVYDNIAFGPKHFGVKKASELEAIVEKSLREWRCGMKWKSKLQKSAFDLAPGEQQRLCIARALAIFKTIADESGIELILGDSLEGINLEEDAEGNPVLRSLKLKTA